VVFDAVEAFFYKVGEAGEFIANEEGGAISKQRCGGLVHRD